MDLFSVCSYKILPTVLDFLQSSHPSEEPGKILNKRKKVALKSFGGA